MFNIKQVLALVSLLGVLHVNVKHFLVDLAEEKTDVPKQQLVDGSMFDGKVQNGIFLIEDDDLRELCRTQVGFNSVSSIGLRTLVIISRFWAWIWVRLGRA